MEISDVVNVYKEIKSQNAQLYSIVFVFFLPLFSSRKEIILC